MGGGRWEGRWGWEVRVSRVNGETRQQQPKREACAGALVGMATMSSIVFSHDTPTVIDRNQVTVYCMKACAVKWP